MECSWLVSTLAALALFNQGRGPLEHVSAPAPLTTAASSCAPCHVEIYDEWRASGHGRAWSNRVFLASYRREPLAWCVSCHAPTFSGALPAPGARDLALAEGVDCAACHLRDGFVLAARAPSARAQAAHPIRVAPLERAELCGGCHQFNVPTRTAPTVEYGNTPMQSTLAEWRVSPAARAGSSCQDCHMTGGSHRFPGGHDLTLLRATVSVSAVASPGSVEMKVTARGAGHRVPTGDPFRRLIVALCADAACEEPLAQRVLSLAPDETRRLTIALDEPAVAWRLRYSFAAPSTQPALFGADREIEIARGAILGDGARSP